MYNKVDQSDSESETDERSTLRSTRMTNKPQKYSKNVIKLAMSIIFCSFLLVFIGFVLGFEFNKFFIFRTNTDGNTNIPDSNTNKIRSRIFPIGTHPYDGSFFGASNGMNAALTAKEQEIVDDAKKKCENLKCCREDDNDKTDSSQCKTYGYTKCLQNDNACVWDCSNGDGHYKHIFGGLRGKLGEKVGTNIKEENEQTKKNENNEKPQTKFEQIDECGTIYEIDITGKDENDFLDKIKKDGQESDSHDNGDDIKKPPQTRRLSRADGNGEYVEGNHRNLYIMGQDTRTSITSWTWPYYKDAYVLFDTDQGTMRCSAEFITGQHLLTAGHCVSDGRGHFYRNWRVFANHNAGYSKQFSVRNAWVFNGWHFNYDWNWDIAMLVLHTTNAGFGWFGFGWHTGIASNWQFEMIGYPSDRGQALSRQTVYMDYSITYNLLKTKTGDVIPGNSGGPLILYSNKIVYGVVSHHHPWFGGYVRITKEKFEAMCAYIRASSSAYTTHC